MHADTDTGADVTARVLATIEQARDIHAAIPPENPFEAITLHGMQIAAAAVRLVAATSGDRVYRPWWGAEADDVGQCCVACQRAVLFGEAWSDIDHQPDCPAMQIDAAIRAAGEAGHV